MRSSISMPVKLKQRGILLEHDMMLPENISISDTDLCKIYGNLLENAVDAVAEQSREKNPYVKILTRLRIKNC